MADMQVADVRKLIDGLRWDRRRHPYSGRREYSQRAQAVAAAVADMIEAGDACGTPAAQAESVINLARRLNLWTFQGFHEPELTVKTTRNLPV